jgi:hypothetical protein
MWLFVFLLAILVALIVIARGVNRQTKIQRAAAIAAGTDISAVSRWRCDGCRLVVSAKPVCCIRCKGESFTPE